MTESAEADRAALKRLFLSSSADDDVTAAEEKLLAAPPPRVDLSSLRPDVPLCRWPWAILPNHQRVVVVHEPQYILMFEQLLASPRPHEYVHLLLHGGTDDLDSEEFALRPGSKGAMAGTLVRIVASLRSQVQTSTQGLQVEGLVMVVQGLSRVHVTRQTQQYPYSRADVLLTPDVEALRAAARASRRWLRGAGTLARTDAVVRTRLALEAAAADDAYWLRHELANASLVASPTPKICQLSASHRNGYVEVAAREAVEAMKRVPLLPRHLWYTNERSSEEEENTLARDAADLTVLLPDGAADAAFGNASAWHCEWIRSILDAAEDYAVEGEAQLGRRPSLGGLPQAVEQGADLDATEEADDDATIAQLEVQVWLELDGLVNPDAPRGEGASARLMTDADVPPELLGLLPPPPQGGWPEGFGLHDRQEAMEARARLEALVGGGGSRLAGLIGSAADAGYPLRRRAGRLSYAVWAVIGDEDGAPLQRVLEATSTAERLRFAVLRMRTLTGRSFRPPGA